MFDRDQYQLLDFGDGRKLERFGSEVLDRPSPAADGFPVAAPTAWSRATARFEVEVAGSGRWTGGDGSIGTGDEGSWPIVHDPWRLDLQRSGSGNVGVFPEQAPNWDWIADQVARCADDRSDRAPRVLNLFAYTGGATLAAAAAGAEVTHVDSSGPTVAWARRNAAASGLAEHPIRWLVEDAMRFVVREHRRGNRYDGIIADPPTYGHGPKGRAFKFRDHVAELMAGCGELLASESTTNRFLVFSCHVPGFGLDDATAVVRAGFDSDERGRVEGNRLDLETADRRRLAAGVTARWSTSSP